MNSDCLYITNSPVNQTSPVLPSQKVSGEPLGSSGAFCPHCGSFLDADFLHECEDGVFRTEELRGDALILNTMNKGGGDSEQGLDSFMSFELSRSEMCGKSLLDLHEWDSDTTYYKRVHCGKWWCPTCGGAGGTIHRTRLSKIREKLPVRGEYLLRQFIFTVPESVRCRFKSRDGINQLFQSTARIIKKYFPEKSAVQYLHLFGDKRSGVFHPHINVHVLDEIDSEWKLSSEKIEEIKLSWLRALRGYVGALEVADVHYRFLSSAFRRNHAVKYMSRPAGIYNYKAVVESGDYELLFLLTVALKGLSQIRWIGKKITGDEMIGDEADVVKEVEKEIGKKLRFRGSITQQEFRGRFRVGIDGEELSPGLYVVWKAGEVEAKRKEWREKRGLS